MDSYWTTASLQTFRLLVKRSVILSTVIIVNPFCMSTLPTSISLTVLPKTLLDLLVNQLQSCLLLIFHDVIIFMVVNVRMTGFVNIGSSFSREVIHVKIHPCWPFVLSHPLLYGLLKVRGPFAPKPLRDIGYEIQKIILIIRITKESARNKCKL